MINKDVLMKYGAELVLFDKGDFIFEIGMSPDYYYQIVNGQVKLNTYDEEEREYIYSIYRTSENFGDPSIFLKRNYICNAIAVIDTEILKLPKDQFLLMIKENHEVSLKISYSIANKLYYQGIIAPKNSSQDAEKRILTLLHYFKSRQPIALEQEQLYKVDLTRQQIADMTGLRVETVIRSIRKLKEDNQLRIINGKVVL